MSVGLYEAASAGSWLPAQKNLVASAAGIAPSYADRQFAIGNTIPQHRAEVWQRGISELFTDLSPDIANPEIFTGSIDTIYRNDISISHIAAGAQRVHRCGTHSRGRRIERFFLNVQLEGSSRVRHENGTSQLVSGDCVLVNPNDAYILDFNAPFRQLCVQFPDWWLAEKLGQPLHTVIGKAFSLGHGAGAVLSSALKAIISSPGDDVQTPELVELFGETLARAMRITSRLEAPHQIGPAQHGMFARLSDYIHRNFRDEAVCPLSAATALDCSIRSVHSACSTHGTTFRTLLTDTRLAAAARMLLRGDSAARISSICFDCGFSDVSHFNRLFRRKYGVAPRTYRSH